MSILPKTSMERRYVSTPTYGDVAYVDWGSGPDALFIHGVFLNVDLWGHQVSALFDLRHCLAIDLLAHGDSPCPSGHRSMGVQAAMVVEFLDALDLERLTLSGTTLEGRWPRYWRPPTPSGSDR